MILNWFCSCETPLKTKQQRILLCILHSLKVVFLNVKKSFMIMFYLHLHTYSQSRFAFVFVQAVHAISTAQRNFSQNNLAVQTVMLTIACNANKMHIRRSKPGKSKLIILTNPLLRRILPRFVNNIRQERPFIMFAISSRSMACVTTRAYILATLQA